MSISVSDIGLFPSAKLACGTPKHSQDVILTEDEVLVLEAGKSVTMNVQCDTCTAMNQITITKQGDKFFIKPLLI